MPAESRLADPRRALRERDLRAAPDRRTTTPPGSSRGAGLLLLVGWHAEEAERRMSAGPSGERADLSALGRRPAPPRARERLVGDGDLRRLRGDARRQHRRQLLLPARSTTRRWPPPGTPEPTLLAPLVLAAVLAASLVPLRARARAARAAARADARSRCSRPRPASRPATSASRSTSSPTSLAPVHAAAERLRVGLLRPARRRPRPRRRRAALRSLAARPARGAPDPLPARRARGDRALLDGRRRHHRRRRRDQLSPRL